MCWSCTMMRTHEGLRTNRSSCLKSYTECHQVEAHAFLFRAVHIILWMIACGHKCDHCTSLRQLLGHFREFSLVFAKYLWSDVFTSHPEWSHQIKFTPTFTYRNVSGIADFHFDLIMRAHESLQKTNSSCLKSHIRLRNP